MAAASVLLALAPGLCGASATRTILVFPFENQSPRPDLDWLSVGFAEIISSRLADPALRREVCEALHQLGFKYITLDLDGFRSGSMNAGLPMVKLVLSPKF